MCRKPANPRSLGLLALSLAALLPSGSAAAQGRERPPANRSMDQPPPPPPPPPPAAPEGRVSRPMDLGASTDRSPQGGNGPTERWVSRPVPGREPRTDRIVAPRPLPRRTVLPDPPYWKMRRRDLQLEIQWMCRRGPIQVHPIEDTVGEFTDWAPYPSGWKAYGVAVPAGEKVHLRLHHPSEGWFSLRMMNKWGQLESGMLQNLIPTGNPEVSYKNLSDKPRAVYILVDDPGWMSSKDNVFRMVITRSWDPKVKSTDLVPFVQGVWAVKGPEEDKSKPKEKKESAPAPAKQG